MVCGFNKSKKKKIIIIMHWSPPLEGVLDFNAYGVVRKKLGLADIGGVLCNSREDVLISISKSIRVRDSNEAEVLVILEALRIYSNSFDKSLILKSDSSNTIA